jgi:hypothetical protein
MRRGAINGSTFYGKVPGRPEATDVALSGGGGLTAFYQCESPGGGGSSVTGTLSVTTTGPGYSEIATRLGVPFAIGATFWVHVGVSGYSGVSFGPNVGDQMTISGHLGVGWGGVDVFSAVPGPLGGALLLPVACELIGTSSGFDYSNPASICLADRTHDGNVDDADFVEFAAAYNILDCSDPSMTAGCPSDLNTDAFVDDSDFVLFAEAYDRLLCE